jgi:hypothetical protein
VTKPLPTGGLSCVVVNVNGLSDLVKRRTLFKRLLQMQVDVAVLCETHSTSDEQVRGWVQGGAGLGRPWQGHATPSGHTVLTGPGGWQCCWTARWCRDSPLCPTKGGKGAC